jgi:predicted phosphoribosyltransferase
MLGQSQRTEPLEQRHPQILLSGDPGKSVDARLLKRMASATRWCDHVTIVFANRRHAEVLLAERLAASTLERPVVIALPRGGVPVAFEIAKALHAPLEILGVRKLGAPGNPEFAVGAIAEGGVAVIDRRTARRVGMSADMLDQTVAREAAELGRQLIRYRGQREPLDVRDRTAIVVDDGLATGLTDLAAIRALRARGAARVVVAVPVGVADALERVATEADEVVCHTIPVELIAVGAWYDDFAPVSDEEVVALLDELAARASAPTATV